MGLSNINSISDLPLYILAAVIVAFLVYPIKRIVADWFESRDGKKRRSLWINFLRSHYTINECISTFENIKYPVGKLASVSVILGVIFGFLVFIISSHSLNFTGIYRLSLAILVTNCVPYLSSIVLFRYVNSIEKGRNLINKSSVIINLIAAINWFMLMGFTLIIISVSEYYTNLNQISTQIAENIFLIIFISLTLITSAFAVLNINLRKRFLDDLKYSLNEQHVGNYPSIEITTLAGDISGKIQNVFNENLIILDCKETNIVAKWEDINIIKLRDESGKSLDSSHFHYS